MPSPSLWFIAVRLSEDIIDRARKLAGTFIEGVQPRLGIKIGPGHALWTSVARHASWLLHRFQPVTGATPFEPVYGKNCKRLPATYGGIGLCFRMAQHE